MNTEARIADDQDFERLKHLCDVHDGWTNAYEQKPTSVWTKPTNDSNFHMIKVLTVYKDIAGSVLYDVLHDPQYRHLWDKHMIHSIDVGFLNPNNDVSYYAIDERKDLWRLAYRACSPRILEKTPE